MARIAVVYFSQTGMTNQLAKAVISGINDNKNVSVLEYQIVGKDIKEGRFVNPTLFDALQTCDAIIIGSPTYMGSVSAQFKAFADATSELWSKQQWADKVAAGFTSGSALNGDQSTTLQYLITLACQHGMYWVGLDAAHGFKDHGVNRLGCQLGVVAQADGAVANEMDIASARYLGVRVSKLVMRLSK